MGLIIFSMLIDNFHTFLLIRCLCISIPKCGESLFSPHLYKHNVLLILAIYLWLMLQGCIHCFSCVFWLLLLHSLHEKNVNLIFLLMLYFIYSRFSVVKTFLCIQMSMMNSPVFSVCALTCLCACVKENTICRYGTRARYSEHASFGVFQKTGHRINGNNF